MYHSFLYVRLLGAALLLVLVAAHSPAGPGDPPPDLPQIPLAGFDRTVLATSDSHVLWYSSELVEATRGHRVESVTLRYYLQEVGEPEASLVYQEVVQGRHPQGAILDGFIAILMGNVLLINTESGDKRYETPALDGHRGGSLALYSDGAVVQALGGGLPEGAPRPAYWVPIKGGALQYDAKWALTDDRGFVSSVQFARSGDKLVWITASEFEWEDRHKHRPHMAVANLARQTVDVRELPLHFDTRVRAFDGRTIYTGASFIDIETAQVTRAVTIAALGMIDGRLFGFRGTDDGVALVYVDVDRPTEVSTLATFERREGGARGERSNELRLRNAFLVDEERVLVWKGTTWVEWPARRQQ